jgi:drug/metabolite transporter (DMT)-like permease
VEARSRPLARRPAELAGLALQPRWLAATALAVLGWPLQLGALALAPLMVVQPTLALGLVLLLALGARLLGERVGARAIAATAAIAAGVGALAWAAPEPSHVHGGALAIAGSLVALAAVAAAPWLPRTPARGHALIAGAGCAYAAAALTSKLLVDALAAGDLAGAAGWAVLTAALAGLGLGDEMAALQRVAAARVAGGAFALQVAVPVLLAPLLADERWSATPLGGAVIVAGLGAVIAGALGLEATPAVSRLVSAGRGQ